MRRFDPARLLEALRHEHVIPPPKGWSTVEQVRQELRLTHVRNASSRAADLARRGLLERMAHQFKADTGQCHKAYVYRPLPPYRTIREASEGLHRHEADAVPKGWVRIVDLAVELRVSDVAIRGRVFRAGLRPRYFKTPRGIIGLHRNAYYRKADILRLYRKAS
jgi:hypothetical protein